MGQGGFLIVKGKSDSIVLVIPLRQKGKVREFTYFLLYDHQAIELAQILNSIMSFKAHMIKKPRQLVGVPVRQ